MRTYVAISHRDNFTTELQFCAGSEAHAEKVCDRHGWVLMGEVLLDLRSDEIEAMIESYGHTLQ